MERDLASPQSMPSTEQTKGVKGGRLLSRHASKQNPFFSFPFAVPAVGFGVGVSDACIQHAIGTFSCQERTWTLTAAWA
jgi:hypothetical protein